MFEVNDLVMYGGIGVCRVEAIEAPDFGKTDDELYYVLDPVYHSGTIYAPVENQKVFIRPVISAEQANDLIDEMPKVHTEIYRGRSIQQLSGYYQSIIDSHKCLDLIKLTKSIHKKKVAASRQNRRLGQIDRKFMKKAEDLLFGELAAALDIPIEEVEDYIAERTGVSFEE